MMKNISIKKFKVNLVHAYEGWLETLSIMADKEAMTDIKKARREIAQGKYYKFEDVFSNIK